jgi:acylphosphatase
MPVERRRVLYQGRVQGVGFRYTTQRIALGFAVAGYVRNLDDGRVEVVAEGEPDQISAFLDAVSRAMSGKIHEARVELEPSGQSKLAGFSIRF